MGVGDTSGGGGGGVARTKGGRRSGIGGSIRNTTVCAYTGHCRSWNDRDA
jgi:hypothetical protein